MKPILLLLILLLTTNFCFAQNMNTGGPDKKGFYQEIHFEQVNGKIIIPVQIAGSVHKFLLDTGAPFTISREIAEQLGVTPTLQGNTADAFGNISTSTIATVENIKVGAINFKNVPALIGSNPIYECFGVDGNIGSNLLRSTIVKFNSKAKIVTITDDPAKLNLNSQNSIPLDINKNAQSSPSFVLELGTGVTGDYVIDTGDSGFLELSNTYMQIFKSHKVFEILATGYGSNAIGENGGENSSVKKLVVFPVIKLAHTVFKNVKTETVFNNIGSGNNTIGVKVLEYGILTLDYLHGKLYFDPFNNENNLAEKNWPVSPNYNGGKLVIGVVWDKFMKGQVKPGQQIMAIDGVSYEHIDLCNLITQKSILQGKEQAVLTIKDEKGNLSQLTIVKQ